MWEKKHTISANKYPKRFDSIVIHPSASFINLPCLPFTKHRDCKVVFDCRESRISTRESLLTFDTWYGRERGKQGQSNIWYSKAGKREGKKEVAPFAALATRWVSTGISWHPQQLLSWSHALSNYSRDLARWAADTLISCYSAVGHRSAGTLTTLHSDWLTI